MLHWVTDTVLLNIQFIFFLSNLYKPLFIIYSIFSLFCLLLNLDMMQIFSTTYLLDRRITAFKGLKNMQDETLERVPRMARKYVLVSEYGKKQHPKGPEQ